MGSKKIIIRRKFTFIEEANNDPAVKDYFNMSYRAIGSQFKVFGKVYESGLTREEENLLMPEVTDKYPEDKKDFRSAVQRYYQNINTLVPAEGLPLEIGLEKDAPLSENNFPLNIDHYLRYRHALKHLQVGQTLEEAEKYQHKLFYIDDPEQTTKNQSQVSEAEDAARLEYFRVIEDQQTIDMVLTLMGVDTRAMRIDDKVLKLKALASIRSSESNDVNIRRLKQFVDIAKDKDLAAKYEVEMMVGAGVLERIRTAILVTESGDQIGGDMKEAVHWFRDKSNSKEVNTLRARYREIGKKVQQEELVGVESSADYDQQGPEPDEVVSDGIVMNTEFGMEDDDTTEESTDDDETK